jgi:hypothetical protein
MVPSIEQDNCRLFALLLTGSGLHAGCCCSEHSSESMALILPCKPVLPQVDDDVRSFIFVPMDVR